MVKEKEDGTAAMIKAMADVLFELQLSLEPIRDKALDEKARLTGYAQCAEQMIKIIATRAEDLKKQAEEKQSEEKEEEKKVKEKKTKAKESKGEEDNSPK